MVSKSLISPDQQKMHLLCAAHLYQAAFGQRSTGGVSLELTISSSTINPDSRIYAANLFVWLLLLCLQHLFCLFVCLTQHLHVFFCFFVCLFFFCFCLTELQLSLTVKRMLFLNNQSWCKDICRQCGQSRKYFKSFRAKILRQIQASGASILRGFYLDQIR